MRMLKMDYPQAEQMFRRMVFNVLATNYDDHTKNFSFRLKQNGQWENSPGYDICYSFDPNNIWVSQHTLSINGKRRDITKTDLLKLAKDNNIKKARKDNCRHLRSREQMERICFSASVPLTLKEAIWNNLIAPKFDLD